MRIAVNLAPAVRCVQVMPLEETLLLPPLQPVPLQLLLPASRRTSLHRTTLSQACREEL